MRILKPLVAILAILAIFLYVGPLLKWLYQPLVINDHIEKANAIVILSGGLNQDGSLGSSTKERMDYGLKLFQEGYAPKVILSGGGFNKKITDARMMYDYALENGFPSEVFILEPHSESTYENVILTSSIVEEKGYQSIILVTSPYHSYRAKKMFNDKKIKVISSPVVKSELYTAKGEDKVRMFKLVALEYIKYGIYQLGLR